MAIDGLVTQGARASAAIIFRADSKLAPSQWEMSLHLQSNTVSHWWGTNLELALILNLFHRNILVSAQEELTRIYLLSLFYLISLTCVLRRLIKSKYIHYCVILCQVSQRILCNQSNQNIVITVMFLIKFYEEYFTNQANLSKYMYRYIHYCDVLNWIQQKCISIKQSNQNTFITVMFLIKLHKEYFAIKQSNQNTFITVMFLIKFHKEYFAIKQSNQNTFITVMFLIKFNKEYFAIKQSNQNTFITVMFLIKFNKEYFAIKQSYQNTFITVMFLIKFHKEYCAIKY